MRAVKEITNWDLDYQPNHVYLLDGDKLIAYIPANSTEPEYLKTPMRIETRNRKFIDLKVSPFTVTTKSSLVEVKGSKGDSYWVDLDKGTCTCPAFKYSKSNGCKHIKDIV
jgi:hypothetical protein